MQTILSLLPANSIIINDLLTVEKKDGEWTYYLSLWPIYTHREKDHNSFRLICALLLNSSICRQCELVKAFGVKRRRLNRAFNQLKEKGMESFFKTAKGRTRGHVFTPGKLLQAQQLLDQGLSRKDAAEQLGIEYSTFNKAINSGRLSIPAVTLLQASTQSERTKKDALAIEEIGTACTQAGARIAASFGLINGVETQFQACLDLPNGGVLCALPALLENGLLSQIAPLGMIEGYYTGTQILIVLSFMLLTRVQNIEQLRHIPPGEFGKLIGLDRIPEARCLRSKMKTLADDSSAEKWAAGLASFWMEKYADTTGFLYVDGHVKIYGGKTKLPLRYVSRQRLCLKGISFYWINDAVGQPFFVIEKQIDSGMLDALRTDIIPRLLKDIPNQPGEQELQNNPELFRFVLVFDREGASPAFFKEVWDQYRIACLTYRKNPTADWPADEFEEIATKTINNEPITMKLAERNTTFGKEISVKVKEVRKLCESGHQTAIITTAKSLDTTVIASQMFARWCQENFFAYGMHHFGIDELTEYGTEPFPDTKTVINPKWRDFDREKRKLITLLNRKIIYLHNMDNQKRADPHHKNYEQWLIKKNETIEAISKYKEDIESIKAAIKEVAHHIKWSELPTEQQFQKLKSPRRTLMNTIGMICYRAETTMATLMMGKERTFTDARAVLQALFTTTADLEPDQSNSNLNIYLHTASTPAANRWLVNLFEQLNQTETNFPGTKMKMVFHSIANNTKPT